MAKRYSNDRLLFFSDPHFPFEWKHTFRFLKELNDEYDFDRVICGGDELDMYAVSQYNKDSSMDVFTRELREGRKRLRKLHSIFPRIDFLSSNHCNRPYMKALSAGIPRELLLPYNKLIGAEDWDWKWHDDLVLTVNKSRSQIYFVHTKTGSALQNAKALGMNVCMAHHHTLMGINYFTTPSRRLFGVDSGCLISDKGPAYSYSKGGVIRPTRGAAVIIEGTPFSIPA